MDLNTVWFILIVILFVGYFLLEGFDYGVGILLPWIGKNDNQRRVVINTIGPHWDGNEVWLITAGGATFAAFPDWYATLFSGFYLALFFILIALIVRGVALEFRSKQEDPRWRNLWDWMIFVGSLIPAFLWGVAITNIVRGVPIDAEMNYVGGFFNLLNGYALIGGLTSLATFTLHGAVFISLKTADTVMEKSHNVAKQLWFPAVFSQFAFLVATYRATDIIERLGVVPGIVPIAAAIAILLVGYFLRIKRGGWSFIMTSLSIAFSTITLFMVLYPRVMVSSLNPAWSLTIYNTSSSPYTLRVMTIIALIFVPVVLAYQGWTYWVFRQRLTSESHLEY